MIIVLAVVLVLLFVGLAVAASSVHILREYERAVVFRLGRLSKLQGPGVVLLAPFINRVVRVSLRTVTLQVPPQEVITRDNVPARVTAVAYFRVIDPNKSIVEIQDVQSATSQIAQTTLRSVLGQSELDEMLAHREQINQRLQQIIDEQTEPWGIKVTIVEIKDMELPQTMQRAMARQAEAEREKRAKIIHADGEFQASQMLADAAKVIGSEPASLQLRYLQTLTEIATERNSTIIFPVPLELLSLIPHASSELASFMTGRPTTQPSLSQSPHSQTAPAVTTGSATPAMARTGPGGAAPPAPTIPPPGFAEPGQAPPPGTETPK